MRASGPLSCAPAPAQYLLIASPSIGIDHALKNLIAFETSERLPL